MTTEQIQKILSANCEKVLRDFQENGVNRISIWIGEFDPTALEEMVMDEKAIATGKLMAISNMAYDLLPAVDPMFPLADISRISNELWTTYFVKLCGMATEACKALKGGE